MKYNSDSSKSEDSDSDEYDFIKKARDGGDNAMPGISYQDRQEAMRHADTVKKVLDDTNKGSRCYLFVVAQEIFSILPSAKLGKGEQVASISGGLKHNKDFKFVESGDNKRNQKQEARSDNDGMITVNRSELIDKVEYEREKIRQVSRAEFEQERNDRMNRMMPNKDDKSKNNLRALAFDVSGNLEKDMIKSQKTFQNSRKKYGW